MSATECPDVQARDPRRFVVGYRLLAEQAGLVADLGERAFAAMAERGVVVDTLADLDRDVPEVWEFFVGGSCVLPLVSAAEESSLRRVPLVEVLGEMRDGLCARQQAGSDGLKLAATIEGSAAEEVVAALNEVAG